MKITAFLLIIVLVFSLVSCSGSDDPMPESEAASVNASASEPSASEPPSETDNSEDNSNEISEEISEEDPVDRTIDRTGSRILISEGCSYTVKGDKHGTYADDGTHLTDGKFGGDVGYGWNAPGRGEIILDLGVVTDGLADFDVMLAADSWGLIAPGKAVYSVSDDKKNWQEIGVVHGDGVIKEPAWAEWNNYFYPLMLEQSVSGRYVRVVFTGNNMNSVWAHEIAVWKYESIEQRELHVFAGTEEISNLTFTNRDANSMGDQYAPGYCVYSRRGYNKAEFIFELSQIDVNNRGSKNGHVTCYVFLGINVFNALGWQNCCDAGFTYDGDSTGWHLFWATATNENGERGWNANSKALNSKHDYKLILDSSAQNGKATVTAIDLYDGSVADSMEFDLWGSRADGSNTAYLTDIAIDWADAATLVDTQGNPTTESNWVEVTLANMGQGIHMKNVRLYDIKLYKDEECSLWTEEMTDTRGIWSDAEDPISVVTTRISHIIEDYEYIIDLDLG